MVGTASPNSRSAAHLQARAVALRKQQAQLRTARSIGATAAEYPERTKRPTTRPHREQPSSTDNAPHATLASLQCLAYREDASEMDRFQLRQETLAVQLGEDSWDTRTPGSRSYVGPLKLRKLLKHKQRHPEPTGATADRVQSMKYAREAEDDTKAAFQLRDRPNGPRKLGSEGSSEAEEIAAQEVVAPGAPRELDTQRRNGSSGSGSDEAADNSGSRSGGSGEGSGSGTGSGSGQVRILPCAPKSCLSGSTRYAQTFGGSGQTSWLADTAGGTRSSKFQGSAAGTEESPRSETGDTKSATPVLDLTRRSRPLISGAYSDGELRRVGPLALKKRLRQNGSLQSAGGASSTIGDGGSNSAGVRQIDGVPSNLDNPSAGTPHRLVSASPLAGKRCRRGEADDICVEDHDGRRNKRHVTLPTASQKAPFNSCQNLQRFKKCPECGHIYGNKMGGRDGGSQCKTVQPVIGPDGKPLLSEDGRPVVQRCSYIFVSNAKRKSIRKCIAAEAGAALQPLDSSAEAPVQPSEAGTIAQHVEEGLQPLSTLEDNFRDIMSRVKEDVERQGASFYSALAASTSTMCAESTDARTFYPGWNPSFGSPSSLVLLQHFSGPAAWSMYGRRANERAASPPVRLSLAEAYAELCRAHEQAERNRSSAGLSLPTAPPSFTCEEAWGSFIDDVLRKNQLGPRSLSQFLEDMDCSRCHGKFVAHGIDLRGLLKLVCAERANSARTLSLMLGVPIGVACKITQQVMLMMNDEQVIPKGCYF